MFLGVLPLNIIFRHRDPHTYMTSLFVEQPNLRLKLPAALCKTVLKLGSRNSPSM